MPDLGSRMRTYRSRRSGEFPRSRMVGDRTVWVEREIDAWIAALPNRQLKGDAS
jgi:predicted DNA-binding transcriptional regulator AlpA